MPRCRPVRLVVMRRGNTRFSGSEQRKEARSVHAHSLMLAVAQQEAVGGLLANQLMHQLCGLVVPQRGWRLAPLDITSKVGQVHGSTLA